MNKLSANTLLSIHTRLSAIFNFGIKHHGLHDNPAKRAGNFDVQVEKRMNFWELFEFKRFIKYVFELKFRALFMTLYFSGLRKGELLALTWGDIDFKNKTIDVNKTDHNRIVTTPKTNASIRKLLLPQQVLDLLTEIKKETNAKDTYNMFGEFNESLSTTTLDNKFAAFVKASEYKRFD
ncbi:site-specific integrase [Paenisporosarcina sp. OV554]|uniref:site-specific integrase n=1 Tax=Paenisporosarcina sp. OV554 TaxID=2135694 RepID=UPI000D42DC24|nr:site-specific integrase [Paenisporosarcina sp. OV554]PUB13951.1 phage integrase family protein [Paenisporosarcina sp. OV554]